MVDWLCTLAQARAEIKAATGDTVDDAWLISNIPLVSTRINNLTRLRFVPWYELYYYDAFGAFIDDIYRKLDLGRPLLYPVTVIDALGNTLTLGTDYVTVPQDNPAWQLQRINVVFGWSYGINYGVYFWIAPLAFERAIKVTGIWGYRTNYPSEGWVDSLQTITNAGGISATARTFTVTNVNASDGYAQSPAISVGNVLQCITSATPPVYEWMQVIAVDSVTNTVTVQRGINGSTAAIWPQGQEIFTWSVQPEIVRAATRWLGYWYSRRGAYEAVKSDLSQGHTLVYPDDAPAEIMNIIAQTRDWRWMAV